MSPKWRLATVLRVARLRERQAEAAVASAQRDARDAEAETEARRARLAAAGDPTSAPTEAFRDGHDRDGLRAGAVHHAEEDEAAAEARVRDALAGWQHAARQRKSLEHLEEQQKSLHALAAARSAQRALDDLARIRRGSDQA